VAENRKGKPDHTPVDVQPEELLFWIIANLRARVEGNEAQAREKVIIVGSR
jgi:hypothetical protein